MRCKKLILFFVALLTLFFLLFRAPVNTRAVELKDVRFKIFHLLNLEPYDLRVTPDPNQPQNPNQPGATVTPAPFRKTAVIKIVDPNRSETEVGNAVFEEGKGYSLETKITIQLEGSGEGKCKDPLETGKKYVIWLYSSQQDSYVWLKDTQEVTLTAGFKWPEPPNSPDSRDLISYNRFRATIEDQSATESTLTSPSGQYSCYVFNYEIEETTPSRAPTQSLPASTSTPSPTQGGSAQQSPAPTGGSSPDITQQIQNIIQNVSEDNIRAHLEDLVDDDDTPEKDETQTRYTGSPGESVEAQYIKNYFEQLGIQTELQPYSFNFLGNSISSNNIIGTIQGENSNEYYLLTAHMDSRAESMPSDPAPGADDNGSGTVAVMEAAKALKQSDITPKYSIQFILFTGEEQGLYGSKHYVSNLGGKDIKGVINLDMIAYADSSYGDCVEFGYKAYNGGNVISDIAVQQNTTYSIGLNANSYASTITASDHGPFWDNNIPAIYTHECTPVTQNSVYHKTSDKTDMINYSALTKATKVIAATVAQLVLE